jgi:cytochrome c oxidase cbb3-type subunit I/II
MPAYTWLYDAALDTSHTEGKIITLRRLGVPYADGYERVATDDLQRQARDIGTRLRGGGFQVRDDAEILALIAYLQRLGTDIKAKTVADATSAAPALIEGAH